MERDIKTSPIEAGRSIPELLQKLTAETALLVRQELQLARAELMQTVARLSTAAIPLGVGVVLALGTLGALTATLVIALALVVPLWASSLVITVVYAAVAAIMFRRGIAAVDDAKKPALGRTVETLQDDVETVRRGVRRGRTD